MIAECQLATDLVRCAVLMLLYEKPLHGYAIIEGLGERLGRTISPATVYPFLAQMLAVGYLTATHDNVGKRTRTVYSMTAEGRKFSEGIFKRLSQIVSTAIEPNMLRCAHCGCKLYEAGYVKEIDGRRTSFCCVHCAAAHTDEESG
ncbi:MAG: PadR family transcriptional regulator [Thaumarchaeota archaeon]|nr:PadR family transcriptional regulator [Nitrososphaerota archaeon]